MALKLEDKKAVVAQVAEVARNALSVVAADYRGLSAVEQDELRNKARKSGVHLQVVRNTLAIRALADTEFSCMRDVLVGPVILAFALHEPGAAARLIRDFCKENEKLKPKGVALNGKLLPAEAIDKVAKLPTREEALAQLLYVMKAPITQLVRTLAEPYAQVVRSLAAIGRQKEAA